jgi:protease-4
MTSGLKILCFVFLGIGMVGAQPQFLPYHEETGLLLASPGALGLGLYGFGNPALLTYVHHPDLFFTWSDQTGSWGQFKRWGVSVGVPHGGLGIQRQPYGVTDYRIALAAGDRSYGFGVSYGWSGGNTQALDRRSLLSLGGLVRPIPYMSLGVIGKTAIGGSSKEAVFDLGVRPTANELITLFGDYAILNTQSLRNANWSVGAVVEPLPGIRIAGRYFDTKIFSIGLNFSLGRVGIQAQRVTPRQGGSGYNTYGLRVGAYDRNIISSHIAKRGRYLELNLYGPLKYQRFILFDPSNTLLRLLADIEAAREDPTIAGIAINTSGMQINPEMLWEIRTKLKEFKTSGKRVIVFVDRVDMAGYAFASVADKVVMDPTGAMSLEGFLAGRMFLRGTLEKLGVGFEELRYFTYKSAMETFSRDSMSVADREQRYRLIETAYTLVRDEVSTARGLSHETFDRLVDDQTFFLPEDALREGLVDTIGRWEKVKDVLKQLEGKEMDFVGSSQLAAHKLPKDDRWGEPPKIAVIYALGVCAMDEGIHARKLVKDVEAATEDERVKAVVLRVDSPGGDALASDIIAEALKKCKEKKPVVVSQGFVAASGGYWLSMYADTIVASPITVTGSIGVIGGWFYNKELKEKIGVSTDHVRIGTHADLGFGMRVPFVDFVLPDRNLSFEERQKTEQMIKTLYNEFVNKVAAGRKKRAEDIEPIAQGRVWSGVDGKERGLVDVLGGLDEAIRIAQERAGIPRQEPVTVVEYPEPALIDISKFMPRLLPVVADDPVLAYLAFRLKHNGQIMPVLPLEDTLLPHTTK